MPQAASTSHSPGAASTTDNPGVDIETLNHYDVDDLDTDLSDRIDVLEVPSGILESQSNTPTTIVVGVSDCDTATDYHC